MIYKYKTLYDKITGAQGTISINEKNHDRYANGAQYIKTLTGTVYHRDSVEPKCLKGAK